MAGNVGSHRRSLLLKGEQIRRWESQGAMRSAEVEMGDKERHGILVILKLLGIAQGSARESPVE